MNKKLALVIALIVALFAIGSVSAGFFDFLNFGDDSSSVSVDENGQYCTVDEVAAYIKEYHKLPSNYITKKEAQALGWDTQYKRNKVSDVAPGKSIGGDYFGN